MQQIKKALQGWDFSIFFILDKNPLIPTTRLNWFTFQHSNTGIT